MDCGLIGYLFLVVALVTLIFLTLIGVFDQSGLSSKTNRRTRR